MRGRVLACILVMALTTYLIRMIPLTLFRHRITSRFARSFFHYIPYAVLSAMTVPAIFFSTGSLISAACGFAVAFLLAIRKKSLLTVSVAACLTAFLTGWIPF